MKIKFATINITVLFILISCQNDNRNNTNTNSENTDTTSISNDYTLTKVDQFEDYLLALDTTDINGITKATNKFVEIFSKDDSIQNDEGILKFLTYHEKVELNRNERTTDDRKNYTKSYPAYIAQTFYEYASPTMEIYLRQLAKENSEGFADDEAIGIPFETFVQRTIWWEDFSQSVTSKSLQAEAYKQYKTYLLFLTIGMSNTPAINHENKVEEYFINAYAYLEEVYPTSETYITLKAYIELIKRNKIPEAKEMSLKIIKKQ
ncbi:hypothetical protein [Sphingobacterium lumbrici]|uniref:hypothetical protein n=1 Tax=Sphingobacterium lumbrici TaxID=2559600 RepID=UPI001129A80C|nr:hypothetical protein [Sphingobacterium lumbrici]